LDRCAIKDTLIKTKVYIAGENIPPVKYKFKVNKWHYYQYFKVRTQYSLSLLLFPSFTFFLQTDQLVYLLICMEEINFLKGEEATLQEEGFKTLARAQEDNDEKVNVPNDCKFVEIGH